MEAIGLGGLMAAQVRLPEKVERRAVAMLVADDGTAGEWRELAAIVQCGQGMDGLS